MTNSLDAKRLGRVARLILLVILLYVFLGAVQLLALAIKTAGEGAAENLFSGLANPFAGLAVGILATVLWQSSSVTTSTVVAMVGVGAAAGTTRLELAHAVFIVMGANIGTSVTNTLVSLGHIRRSAEFRRAFAGATVHDIFNLLTVLILFPIEVATGFLQKSAQWLVAVFPWQATGGEFHSPIKAAVKWFSGTIKYMLHDMLHLEGRLLAAALFVAALSLIIFSLVSITKTMRAVMADRIEEWLNRVLRRSGLLGLGIGIVITATVQSSSITTSLLVPMFGAGVLTLEAGFPIMLGANIGTTVTALLAATVTGQAGLTIAVVHLLFNVTGTALFLPFRAARRVPIFLSEALAELATKNRIWVVVYVFGTFVLAPILGILIWRT